MEHGCTSSKKMRHGVGLLGYVFQIRRVESDTLWRRPFVPSLLWSKTSYELTEYIEN